ncbi:hypothetical protein ACIQRE_28875 [Streptomyces griseoluteus]
MTTTVHLPSQLAVDVLTAWSPPAAFVVPGVAVVLFAETGPGARG